MSISDNTLSAFLDGELPDKQMTEIRAMVAEDEGLAARLESLATVDSLLKETMSAIDSKPLPADILQLVEKIEQTSLEAEEKPASQAEVIMFPSWRQAYSGMQRYAAAFACVCVALGFFMGTKFFGATVNAVEHWASISAVLNTQLSGDAKTFQDNTRTEIVSVLPQITFINRKGEYCRQFSVNKVLTKDAADAYQSIACQHKGRWKLKAVMPVEAIGDNEEYHLASGASVLDAVIDKMLDADVLSPEEEKLAIESTWKN